MSESLLNVGEFMLQCTLSNLWRQLPSFSSLQEYKISHLKGEKIPCEWHGGGGVRGLDPRILNVGTRGLSGQPHAPAYLPSEEELRIKLNSDAVSAS